MGILPFFKKKEKKIDPTPLIQGTFSSVFTKLFDELSQDEYCWNRSIGVKKYECFVMAKFITDYSFLTLYAEDLDNDSQEGYQRLFNSYFIEQHDIIFNGMLTHTEMEPTIKEKIENYKNIRRENRPPECWYHIYSESTNNPSIEAVNEDVERQENGLELIRNNSGFKELVPKCEAKLAKTKEVAKAFMSAEVVFPRTIRFAKAEFRKMKVKKIKAEIKKLEKAEKKKEKSKK